MSHVAHGLVVEEVPAVRALHVHDTEPAHGSPHKCSESCNRLSNSCCCVLLFQLILEIVGGSLELLHAYCTVSLPPLLQSSFSLASAAVFRTSSDVYKHSILCLESAYSVARPPTHFNSSMLHPPVQNKCSPAVHIRSCRTPLTKSRTEESNCLQGGSQLETWCAVGPPHCADYPPHCCRCFSANHTKTSAAIPARSAQV